MLKLRTRRSSRTRKGALGRIAAIEAAIVALSNDDLLDLVDIFGADRGGPLGEIGSAEMARRGISL